MPFEIVWSSIAKQTFFEVLDQIESRWTIKESKNFVNQVESILNSLKEFARLHTYSLQENIYKCVISKQTSLFYRIKENQIELLRFWDNRQDPGKDLNT